MTARPLLDLCIAGHWRPGRGEVYETCYPATGEPVAALLAATPTDVDEAIEGAHRAWRASGWGHAKPHERAAVLQRVAGLIRRDAERLAQLQRQDNGKPIAETRALVATALELAPRLPVLLAGYSMAGQMSAHAAALLPTQTQGLLLPHAQ